jgi:hypothetical protein
MNNLFGVPGVSASLERDRLAVARTILSTEKTSGFPPQKFHIYKRYLPHFESILKMNAASLLL